MAKTVRACPRCSKVKHLARTQIVCTECWNQMYFLYIETGDFGNGGQYVLEEELDYYAEMEELK